MTMNRDSESNSRILFRVFMCLGIILAGIFIMAGLAMTRNPPPQMSFKEPALQVEVLNVQLESVPVKITGYGEVRTLNVVSLAPEVSGKIIRKHANLDTGEVIPEGEIVFQIDPRDYEAAFIEATATVRQIESSLQRMKRQYEIDVERLKTIQRNRELSKQQYERVKGLFENDRVGTLSGVDQSEQSYNNFLDQAEQMSKTVELYPLQIREAESSLESGRARMAAAGIRLERCTVRAPFKGRVKDVSLEVGQYVSPGMNVVTLADDSILEIHVPLDSRDASRWLPFAGHSIDASNAWVSSLENVESRIRWTESVSNDYWTGILHRVVRFNEQTRTVTVAIRIQGFEARSINHGSLPLVEGMFCSVEIPGRILENVYRVPRWAVSFENTVYVAVDDKLKTIPVEVARVQGDESFISMGLNPGDSVITTRLIDPMENSMLMIL